VCEWRGDAAPAVDVEIAAVPVRPGEFERVGGQVPDVRFGSNVGGRIRAPPQQVKQMMAQGQGGSIVNAASVGGLLAIPSAGHYVASKHAVLGLTKTAAVEYGRYGIRVNAVSAGAVRTEMLQQVFGSEEALDQMATVHPIGRIGRPEEIADAVAWLFSDRSSYYSGQSLTLDGGLSAQRPYAAQPSTVHSSTPLPCENPQ
jgi:A-factor type gamma-butyrolactone 1'-reductase (1S-forming)